MLLTNYITTPVKPISHKIPTAKHPDTFYIPTKKWINLTSRKSNHRFKTTFSVSYRKLRDPTPSRVTNKKKGKAPPKSRRKFAGSHSGPWRTKEVVYIQFFNNPPTTRLTIETHCSLRAFPTFLTKLHATISLWLYQSPLLILHYFTRRKIHLGSKHSRKQSRSLEKFASRLLARFGPREMSNPLTRAFTGLCFCRIRIHLLGRANAS